jgi:hypothetical protein
LPGPVGCELVWWTMTTGCESVTGAASEPAVWDRGLKAPMADIRPSIAVTPIPVAAIREPRAGCRRGVREPAERAPPSAGGLSPRPAAPAGVDVPSVIVAPAFVVLRLIVVVVVVVVGIDALRHRRRTS